MAVELAERTLVDRRKGLGGWAVGLAAYSVLIVSIFPTIRDSAGIAQAVQDYPDAMKEFLGGEAAFDFSSGAGFLNAEMYSLILPLLLAVMAIGFGASLGGDQQSGLMDVILANPVSRRRVVVERALAMLVATSMLAGTAMLTVTAAGAVVDLGVGTNKLLAATTASVLLVMFHGLIALAVGAWSGERGLAIGVATAVFAAGYILNALGALVSWLESFRVLSPYHHAIAPNPLVDGWALGHVSVLVGLCLAAAAAAVILFDRRDLA